MVYSFSELLLNKNMYMMAKHFSSIKLNIMIFKKNTPNKYMERVLNEETQHTAIWSFCLV